MLLLWQVAGSSIPDKGHLANSDCQTCHLTQETTVTPERASILLGRQEKLCADCHPNAARLSHPSGFFPKRPLPKDLPGDWKGELTCSTCHEIHAPHGQGLLRGKLRGQGFCLRCHEQKFFDAMADSGSSVTLSGHLDAREPETDAALPLDSFSLQCLTCHGEKGDLSSVSIQQGVMNHASSSLNHPIGSNYTDATGYGGYHPATALPQTVILPEGRISCISCHVGYSEHHGGLVIANEGSQLCFTCHDL